MMKLSPYMTVQRGGFLVLALVMTIVANLDTILICYCCCMGDTTALQTTIAAQRRSLSNHPALQVNGWVSGIVSGTIAISEPIAATVFDLSSLLNDDISGRDVWLFIGPAWMAIGAVGLLALVNAFEAAKEKINSPDPAYSFEYVIWNFVGLLASVSWVILPFVCFQWTLETELDFLEFELIGFWQFWRGVMANLETESIMSRALWLATCWGARLESAFMSRWRRFLFR